MAAAAFLVPIMPGLCVIPLEKAIVLIGRQSDCDVSLTQSRKVSRRHCCVAQVNNHIIARDLGSTNGIYLNGDRVKKECRLKWGDELMIGDLKFRLQNDPNPQKRKQKPKEIAEPPVKKPAENVIAAFNGKETPFLRGMPGGELPSMDVPVILPDEGRDFAVEASVPKMPRPARNPAPGISGPLVPFERADSEDDVIPLGSDSNI